MKRKRTVDQLNPLERAIHEELASKGRVFSLEELSDKFGRSPKEIEKAFDAAKEAGARGKLVKRSSVAEGFETDVVRVPKERPRIIDISGYDSGHYRIAGTADSHHGSDHHIDHDPHTRHKPLLNFYKTCAYEGFPTVLNGGNWLDGNARFNMNSAEWGFSKQMDIFLNEYPYVQGVRTIFIAGDDHEGWFWQRAGIDVAQVAQALANDYGRDDMEFIGYIEADIALIPGSGLVYNSYKHDRKEFEELMSTEDEQERAVYQHGRRPYPRSTIALPKNDKYAILRIMHAGGGTAYAKSLRSQKIVESLEGGEKPQVIMTGHYHKAIYDHTYNCHVFQLGTTENQSDFMRKKGIKAEVGNWLLDINQDQETGAINGIDMRFIPYIGREFVFDPMKWTRPNARKTYER